MPFVSGPIQVGLSINVRHRTCHMVEAEPQFHLSLSQDIFLVKVRAGRLNL